MLEMKISILVTALKAAEICWQPAEGFHHSSERPPALKLILNAKLRLEEKIRALANIPTT
jgi:hypothetical protein